MKHVSGKYSIDLLNRTSLVVEEKVVARLDLRVLVPCAEYRETVIALRECFCTKSFISWLREVLLLSLFIGWFPISFFWCLWTVISGLFSWSFFPGVWIAFWAGYVFALHWLIKPRKLWYDFLNRRELVGERRMTMDFSRGQLIVAETFDHYPARNQTTSMRLNEFHVMVHQVPFSERGEDETPAVRVMLCSTATLPRWACSALARPVFVQIYDEQQPTELKYAQERAEELRARFESVLASFPAVAPTTSER